MANYTGIIPEKKFFISTQGKNLFWLSDPRDGSLVDLFWGRFSGHYMGKRALAGLIDEEKSITKWSDFF